MDVVTNSRIRMKNEAINSYAKSKKVRPEEKRKTQRGTRLASREEMLAMQAENHYLLDSYDKKGQYSILGK